MRFLVKITIIKFNEIHYTGTVVPCRWTANLDKLNICPVNNSCANVSKNRASEVLPALT